MEGIAAFEFLRLGRLSQNCRYERKSVLSSWPHCDRDAHNDVINANYYFVVRLFSSQRFEIYHDYNNLPSMFIAL